MIGHILNTVFSYYKTTQSKYIYYVTDSQEFYIFIVLFELYILEMVTIIMKTFESSTSYVT